MRFACLIGICLVLLPSTSLAGQQDARAQPSFGAANYAVLAAYLAALVAVGAYFSRREKSAQDYFLAGRRIPWWAAGLSIFGGGLSAITYMAIPAAAFGGDWTLILTYVVPVALIPVVVAYYIPFYRRLRVTTAYEYLEKRFNLPTRLFASTYYIVFQFGRMAIMLFLPAVALATVTGMSVYWCVLIMGVMATLYTVLGGIEAVIWTDVLQVAVLAGGALLILHALAARVDGGLAGIIAAGAQRGKFTTFKWGWDAAEDVVWVMVLGSFFSAIFSNTADQSVVQRYLSTRDERGAKRAAWASALLGIPTGLVFFFLGTALFVFYEVGHPQGLEPGIEGSAILPFFVMREMPVGISGLVVAGIFAAAMSTIDNGMNAIASAFTTDFYRRLRPERSERHYLGVARIVTLAAGVIATIVAIRLCMIQRGSIFELFYRIMNLFGGSLAGLFVLGIFSRRGNGYGSLAGMVVSMGVLLLIKYATSIHFMLHAAIGLGVCVVVGYLTSLLLPSGGKSTQGLTIHTMPRSDE